MLKGFVTGDVTYLLRLCYGSDLNFAPILPMCYGCYGSRGGEGGYMASYPGCNKVNRVAVARGIPSPWGEGQGEGDRDVRIPKTMSPKLPNAQKLRCSRFKVNWRIGLACGKILNSLGTPGISPTVERGLPVKILKRLRVCRRPQDYRQCSCGHLQVPLVD